MKHIFTLLLSLLLFAAPVPHDSADANASGALSSNEQTLFHLLNESRAHYGIAPLTLDEELCEIARIKSREMADKNYFSHTSPTYGNIRSMLSSFGVDFLNANENIARSRTVHHSNAAFLSSEGHRRTMLSAFYTHVGIGVVTDQNDFVTVTEIFVRR